MMGLSLLGAALGGVSAAPAVDQATSYPWCTVGESVGCYYATQQQCEEEVDYHGFCETNPDYHPQSNGAPARPRRRRKSQTPPAASITSSKLRRPGRGVLTSTAMLPGLWLLVRINSWA